MEVTLLKVPSPTLRLGLNQLETAALLGVTRRTLNNWQRTGYGPQPVRDGNRLLYSRAEVEAFAAGAAQ
jgi:predicted site-specific integrase-resolvase